LNISIIVAASTNNVIGNNNQLLWRLPNDMKFFKQTTWAMPVIMGRKTFESMNSKPLNGRLNIVVTRQQNFIANGAVVVANIADALFVAKEHLYKEVFIIGGGEIYKEILPKANKIYMTRVDVALTGDTYFTGFDENNFVLINKEKHLPNEKHLYAYTFETWIKK
jgi:dihydrofolate reductase